MASNQSPRGNAVIGQSGGPTAVINQSLVGVVEGLRGKPMVEKILGAHHAVAGIVKNDFIELQDLSQDKLDRVAKTPSAALGSSRDKPDADYCKKIFDAFEKNNVRYFFYIGGNDSSDTCRIVQEQAAANNYELHAFHVPKTIDNDLVLNDHTPGFGSAAKFVAQAFMGDNLDNKALPGIKIDVVMGRHAGFLTAASMLGRKYEDDGPHLVYVPEVPFSIEQFQKDVEATYKRLSRCLIAVSEGIHDEHGTPIAVKLAEKDGNVERDAHGNPQLSGTGALGDYLSKAVKEHLGPKTRVRADTFGYLQRCFAGCVSPTDAAEARAAGRCAAELATSGETSGSIAIQRVSDSPYKVEYKHIKLTDVAAKTQVLDKKYIVNDNNISDEFKKYLGPIVGELPDVESLTN
ncbi:6-phosphofructokinase [Phycisphaerales bacterium AB-hyl4]|uniref:Pyrophosphate--fructose 6-phosphate 1-phosphotransferase n=1 Tax=Natronomicrosphaera hydrolytica TaxID=3242702 RepID=A0ABV4U8N8_9BACT